jgi:hypothetical protein
MLRISDLMDELQKALAEHGDIPVLVKGEHNEFNKALGVYTAWAVDLNEYYVELTDEDEGLLVLTVEG